jgi:hypothetical protein
MESSGASGQESCLKVNGKFMCFDPSPDEREKKSCLFINNIYFCPKKNGKSRTMKKEVSRFFDIVSHPRMTMGDVIVLKESTPEATIGLVLNAITYALGVYIATLINAILELLVPGSWGVLLPIFVVVGLLLGSLFLTVLKSRIQTATKNTKILEHLVEKTPLDAMKAVFPK